MKDLNGVIVVLKEGGDLRFPSIRGTSITVDRQLHLMDEALEVVAEFGLDNIAGWYAMDATKEREGK